MKDRILVVDDDLDICTVIDRELTKRGFDVRTRDEGEPALRLLDEWVPDLAVLDILLPGKLNGMDLLEQIRERHPQMPVIFVTGLDGDYDLITGLERGADDYLTKPFHPGELLARVRAVLRRAQRPREPEPIPDDAPIPVHGDIVIDADKKTVHFCGKAVDLTKTEYLLLHTLMRRPTKVYNRDELMTGVYGPNTYVADRTITSHMVRLRAKMGTAGSYDPVVSVRGFGYRLLRRPGDPREEE